MAELSGKAAAYVILCLLSEELGGTIPAIHDGSVNVYVQ